MIALIQIYCGGIYRQNLENCVTFQIPMNLIVWVVFHIQSIFMNVNMNDLQINLFVFSLVISPNVINKN